MAIRNAIAQVLSIVYGEQWPWNRNFETSLPAAKSPFYEPRRDLIDTRSRSKDLDSVIVNLKFKF
jgi:hypothetical protein